MFFFDDADGSADGNTGTDAPAANDAAAELLQASSEWCPEAEVSYAITLKKKVSPVVSFLFRRLICLALFLSFLIPLLFLCSCFLNAFIFK
jgi:hypothetical protein